MQQPQFEALANHWSGVKLITLWAVSWRQPGDIYRWTRVSNLAITAPLINSLSESLPGAQGFRDSDGLMMLVSCYSAALTLYTLWFDTLQKDHNNCASPLNMTTHAKRSLSVACPLKVFCLRWLGYWLSSKWKWQLILSGGLVMEQSWELLACASSQCPQISFTYAAQAKLLTHLQSARFLQGGDIS